MIEVKIVVAGRSVDIDVIIEEIQLVSIKHICTS